jgi:hypothetical protein
MREKLNDNPLLQVAVLGVLALIVGFLLITRMGGSSSDTSTATTPAPTDTTAAATTPTTPAATTPATGTATAPATPGVTPTAPAPVTPAPAAGDFKAGPGLPKGVVNAYDKGQVVALLIVDDKGVVDQKLKAIVTSLNKRPDTTLFVVKSKDVGDYSRIAQGVDLQQTPALVVLRPKKLTKGPTPTATIEYGFRGPASVLQMVEDALYKGPTDLPYYPH